MRRLTQKERQKSLERLDKIISDLRKIVVDYRRDMLSALLEWDRERASKREKELPLKKKASTKTRQRKTSAVGVS